MFKTTTSNIINQTIQKIPNFSSGVCITTADMKHTHNDLYYPVSADVNGVNLSFSGRKALTAKKIESYRRFSRKINELAVDKLFIKLLTL